MPAVQSRGSGEGASYHKRPGEEEPGWHYNLAFVAAAIVAAAVGSEEEVEVAVE